MCMYFVITRHKTKAATAMFELPIDFLGRLDVMLSRRQVQKENHFTYASMARMSDALNTTYRTPSLFLNSLPAYFEYNT